MLAEDSLVNYVRCFVLGIFMIKGVYQGILRCFSLGQRQLNCSPICVHYKCPPPPKKKEQNTENNNNNNNNTTHSYSSQWSPSLLAGKSSCRSDASAAKKQGGSQHPRPVFSLFRETRRTIKYEHSNITTSSKFLAIVNCQKGSLLIQTTI